MKWLGRKFGQAADRLQQYTLNDLHVRFYAAKSYRNREESGRPYNWECIENGGATQCPYR